MTSHTQVLGIYPKQGYEAHDIHTERATPIQSENNSEVSASYTLNNSDNLQQNA